MTALFRHLHAIMKTIERSSFLCWKESEISFSKELPVQYSEWMNTIWDISNRDKIKIYLVSEGGESFDLKENVEEEYAEFLKGLESDETVEVSLTIDKKIVNGYLSVYCFEKFAEDISSLPIDKVLTAFSNFMKSWSEYNL